jgi:N-acetylmuramoyl-L-alanine amidase
MLIDTSEPIGNFLVRFGLASLPKEGEPKPTPVPTPAQPKPVEAKPSGSLWEQFIAAVKSSSLTDAMKVACVAQAILESGRGTTRVSKELFNFHGMKYRDTLNGIATPVRIEVTSETKGWDIFAKFPTLDAEIKGWIKFLSREYYAGWEKFKDDSEAFIRHIGKPWCPRADYADVVIALIPEARKLLGINIVTPTPSAPTGKKKIFLDPGHAESKVGARSKQGAQEEDLNRLQAQVIKSQLDATGRFDVTIFDPAVEDLTVIGKAAKGHDMSIHIHHNSHSGEGDPGTEVLFDNDKAEAQSKQLAEKMSEAISKALGTKNRGAKPFSGTVMDVAEQQGTFPVVLTESYFLNPYTQAQAEERSRKAAVAIADVVIKWFA